MYKSNTDGRFYNQSCSVKTIIIAFFECASVPLDIQHAMRMRRIILSSVARLARTYFSKLSHKRHDFQINALT